MEDSGELFQRLPPSSPEKPPPPPPLRAVGDPGSVPVVVLFPPLSSPFSRLHDASH